MVILHNLSKFIEYEEKKVWQTVTRMQNVFFNYNHKIKIFICEFRDEVYEILLVESFYPLGP